MASGCLWELIQTPQVLATGETGNSIQNSTREEGPWAENPGKGGTPGCEVSIRGRLAGIPRIWVLLRSHS